MKIPSFRKLMQHALQLARWERRPPQAGRKRRTPYLPSLEQLEKRALPSTIQPVTPANLQVPASDSAGGASQILTSADGRFTIYTSTAPNLVAGQINTAVNTNVFLYDQLAGTTTLVSHTPGATTTGANGDSDEPRISGDDAWVVFESLATNLVAGQNGPAGQDNVFLYNIATGTNTLVSHRAGSATTSGNGASLTFNTTGFGFSSTSGQFLIFNSKATDLVARQNGPGNENLFLYNTTTGNTTLVSHNASSALTGANDFTQEADLTPDGSSVVYESFATDLVPGQTGTKNNIFLYNNATGNSQLISGVNSGSGNSPANAAGSSFQPYISADGTIITYLSDATDLVAGQATSASSAARNVYYYNTALGTTAVVSGANGSATVTADASSGVSAVSSDGSTIAFISAANNLTPGQGGTTGNGSVGNVFLYSTTTGTLTLASHISTSATTAAGDVTNGATNNFDALSLSSDGRFVTYLSYATTLVPSTNGFYNVYLYDAQSGQNSLVSHVNGSSTTAGNNYSYYARLSDNGSTIAFLSLANNLAPPLNVADGGQNVFVFEVTTGAGPVLASRSAFQASATSLVYGSSGNGQFVLFGSNATNVVPQQMDTNNDQDLFLLDRNTGTITLVSHIPGEATTTGDRGSPTTAGVVDQFANPVISSDGNFVAFVSQADNLVAGQAEPVGADQVFLFDRLTGTVTLLSHNFSSVTTAGDDASYSPVISADGHYVAFASNATDLVAGFTVPATMDIPNVYLYVTVTGTTTLVSHAAGNPFQSGDYPSYNPSLSDDGSYVAFVSLATTLVRGATTLPSENIYLFDRLTGTNTLVSHVLGFPTLAPDPATAPGTPPTVASFTPVISADGSTIAYASFATDLVAGQTGTVDTTDVFLYDVATGTNQLASGVGGSATATANNYSDSPVLNSNGNEVVFRSTATNLVAGQSNPAGSISNIFLYYVPTSNVGLVSHAYGSTTTTAAGDSTGPAIDGLGGLVVYLSTATNLVPSQGNPLGVGVNNAFLFVPATNANVLVSGQSDSASLASATPIFLAIISRDPVAFFNLLSGAGAASAGFSNSLVQLVLSNNAVADGSAPGTLVGTLSVTGSFFAGAFFPPTYTMPAGEANNTSFILGSSVGGQANLFTGFTASVGLQQSYLVSIHVNFNIVDLDDVPGTLAVVVTSPPPPPPPPLALSFLATAGNGTVVARLPNYGVWRFENTSGWVQLTATTASQVDVDANGDVAAILGGAGVWRWEDASGWVQLSASSPLEVSIAGNGIIAALFAGAGVWRWEDLGGWRQLTASSATQVGVDANGDVVAALLNAGVWRYEDASRWVQLTGSTPMQIGIAGNGYVVVSFQGAGVWRWEDASGWVQLTVSNAASVSIDDQGDLVALLAGAGVWRWEDAAGWQQLTGTNAVQVDIGGNGNVVAELQGAGVWRFENVGGWLQLTGTNAG